jgi:hypothetical protein
MFRKSYHFECTRDCGERLHFYKWRITRKQAKTSAKYLISKYNCKSVSYCAMGKIFTEKR